jgi:hypothetical protein
METSAKRMASRLCLDSFALKPSVSGHRRDITSITRAVAEVSNGTIWHGSGQSGCPGRNNAVARSQTVGGTDLPGGFSIFPKGLLELPEDDLDLPKGYFIFPLVNLDLPEGFGKEPGYF